MAINGKVPKKVAIFLFVVALSFASESLFAQKMHAVVVGDLSPAAGWGKLAPNIVIDTLSFGGMLESNMPQHQLNIVHMRIEDDEYSDPQKILEVVRKLNPRPEDTIVFYFSGHGASDDQGHYFALAKGKLRRKQVLDEILRKRPRLTVLITDCCNVRSDGNLFFSPYFQTKPPGSPTPLFRSLFLEPKGIVDINSSAPGEGAFFAPSSGDPAAGTPVEDVEADGGALIATSGEDLASKQGSIFTIELTAWIEKNRSQRRTWDELVRGVSLQVRDAFHDFYPKGVRASEREAIQSQQNVFPVQYPGMPENKGPRTGFLVRDFSGKGAVITRVEANSPASQVFLVDKENFTSLSPQQVIVSINGSPVESTEQVVKAIAQSPQIARLRIREATKGEFDVLIRMRY